MFVDIPTTSQQLEGGDVEEDWHADVREYVNDPAAKTIIEFGVDLTPRTNPLVLFFNIDRYLARIDDDVNVTIEAMTAGYDAKRMKWFGPVVVMKPVTNEMLNYVDVDDSDLPDIQGFFTLGN